MLNLSSSIIYLLFIICTFVLKTKLIEAYLMNNRLICKIHIKYKII